MGRQLPWKRKSGLSATSSASSRTKPSPSSASGVRAKSPSTPASPAPSKKPTLNLSARRGRSPSTSPPPAPPTEEFMVDGVDGDDGYRMVEDELVSVAKMFTAHLHAAEYHRLKNLAKAQNADTIQDISRPVVGRLSDGVQRRQDALNLAKRQRKGIKRARTETGDGGDTDSESPWSGTALAGLMDAPKSKSVSLKSVVPLASSSRAAAGFSERSPMKATRHGLHAQRPASPTPGHRKMVPDAGPETDDDDDLDRPAREVPRRAPAALPTRASESRTPSRASTFPTVSTSTPAPYGRSSTFASASTTKVAALSDEDLDDDDPLRKIRERLAKGAGTAPRQRNKPSLSGSSSIMDLVPF